MANRKAQPTVSEQLQRAVQQSDQTVYALAKLTGISSQQISRFAKGERGLLLSAFDELAKALGMQLAPVAAALEAPVAADGAVLAAVRRGQTRNKLGTATLSGVFKALQACNQALTIGQFHDALRRLQAGGKIRLTPWTQAMYQLTDPETCLLCGREIMAFVEVR